MNPDPQHCNSLSQLLANECVTRIGQCRGAGGAVVIKLPPGGGA
jgi:hypothetical protein